MRRIIDGAAYDTETSDLIVELGGDERDEWIHRLYRTRTGAYFLYESGPEPGEQPHEYHDAEDFKPLSDRKAKKWLERNANGLVENYFGRMPEAGAAGRRFTLRLPNNLATRLGAIAQSKNLTLTRYIVRCLERCASEDGRPVPLASERQGSPANLPNRSRRPQ
jgi:hypothetical protein